MYQIIKVNKFRQNGALVTKERTLRSDAELNEVLLIAERQGADVDEVSHELEEMGCTNFKGYMIFEL